MTGRKKVLTVDNLRLNLETRRVQNGRGETMHLTPKEARLLAVFMQYPGLILSRRFLMRQVWETNYVGDTRTLEVHVSWLRRKIGANRLVTVRGEGYQFVAGDESST